MAQKKKLSKNRIRAIIVACVSAAVALALIITNFFVPVKYLASYMVVRNKGAKAGVMRVRFVDVGFGDCVIVELPDGKNMLIDGGNGDMRNEARILKLLNKCDIDVIDYLVCTNVNAEHCGGLAEIVRYKTVKKIYMPGLDFMYLTDEYKNFCTAASGSVAAVSRYGETEEGKEYDYFFTFLSPSRYSDEGSEYKTLHDNPDSYEARADASAVIWLEYAGTSFLFTSDVTETVLEKMHGEYLTAGEYLIGERSIKLEDCNVLQVSAHGSKSALYTRFYETVRPEAAVISTNRINSANGVLTDLLGCGCEKIYRTDENGTVTAEVTADGYALV